MNREWEIKEGKGSMKRGEDEGREGEGEMLEGT